MKNIQITDEQYDFLINLSKELHTQDGRMTQDPFFVVRETERQYGVDREYDVDGYEWISDCEECDEDYIWECIWEEDWNENNIPFGIELKTLTHFLYVSNNSEDIKSCYSLDDFSCWLDDKEFIKCYYINIYKYSGAFLTAKACERYIQQNKHNLNEPISYGMSFYRNPEMISLREFLLSLDKEAKTP